MRLAISVLLFALAWPCAAATLTFHIEGDDSAAGARGWSAILSSIGLQSASTHADVEIISAGASSAESDWSQRVEHGTILILEGGSPVASSFGFRPTAQHISVQSIEDLRPPQLRIIWEQAVDVPVFEIPAAGSPNAAK